MFGGLWVSILKGVESVAIVTLICGRAGGRFVQVGVVVNDFVRALYFLKCHLVFSQVSVYSQCRPRRRVMNGFVEDDFQKAIAGRLRKPLPLDGLILDKVETATGSTVSFFRSLLTGGAR